VGAREYSSNNQLHAFDLSSLPKVFVAKLEIPKVGFRRCEYTLLRRNHCPIIKFNKRQRSAIE